MKSFNVKANGMGARNAKIYIDKRLEPTEDYPLPKAAKHHNLRFIDYEVLKILRKFPNWDQSQFITLYQKIKRDESMIIYVSHAWLAG